MRFLKKWLIPIVAGILLVGLAAALIPLSAQEETRAKNELTALTDAAFLRIQAAKSADEPAIAAGQAALLSETRAVVRFLEHDDALLATDALAALCEQLTVDRIDVADGEGALIASSDASRVGFALGAQTDFAWVMGALEDPDAKLQQTDASDPSVLYCCLPRAEIEGFVLLTRNDPFVADAIAQSGADERIKDLPYEGDLLFVAEPGGEDGFFTDSGSLCLRRSQDGVTLIAAREKSAIFEARNAALVAAAAVLLCVMICVVGAYLMRTELVSYVEVSEPEEENSSGEKARVEPRPNEGFTRFEEERTKAEPDEETGRFEEKWSEPEEEPAQPEKPRFLQKMFGRRKERGAEEPELFAETGEEPDDEARRERECAEENAPRQVVRNKGKMPAPRTSGRSKKKPPEDPKDDEDPFDTILD